MPESFEERCFPVATATASELDVVGRINRIWPHVPLPGLSRTEYAGEKREGEGRLDAREKREVLMPCLLLDLGGLRVPPCIYVQIIRNVSIETLIHLEMQ